MRRLGALFYDCLIVIAIEMMAAGVVIAILHALLAMGVFNVAPYADVSDLLTNHPLWSPVYTLYLAVVWIYFFVFFWTRADRHWECERGRSKSGMQTARQSLPLKL